MLNILKHFTKGKKKEKDDYLKKLNNIKNLYQLFLLNGSEKSNLNLNNISQLQKLTITIKNEINLEINQAIKEGNNHKIKFMKTCTEFLDSLGDTCSFILIRHKPLTDKHIEKLETQLKKLEKEYSSLPQQ